MIIVKLIVLFCCVNGFSASPTDYCEICSNHILCKYKAEGPSPSCRYYNSSAKLTSHDINELVYKINERRNFVAMGNSKILPHAADMKKIHWSTKLATFAQRWADQCDPAVHPDREDQCRDLEHVKVGQNIGSVVGPTPGLSVKGFVEMWFIQVLDYDGSVIYYNKSRDYKTNYLTQLIWANTEFVGCGKAKFYVDERKIMLERLVCNFAPKGNIHGKPVYSIGYPGNQCKNEMVPDDQFKGLCTYEDDATHKKLNTQGRPANNLLRILNLSNNSVKHEIDPIRNNLKQSYLHKNSSNEQRNQKTRHIIPNKTYATVKRIPQLRKQMFGNNIMNISKNNNEYHYQHDRGHSHLYHGHEPTEHYYETTTIINTNQDFDKYDYTTEPMSSYSDINSRRFNQYAQCTRRIKPIQDNCALNQCTTTASTCCQALTMSPSTCTEISCTQPMEDHTCFSPTLPDPCSVTQQICPPISTDCKYNTKCPCSVTCSTISCCSTTLCPTQCIWAGTFQYNDMIPNVVVRSGNYKIPQEKSSQEGISLIINPDKTMYDEKDFDQIHKDVTDYVKYKIQERDYLYRPFHAVMRKKRQLENHMTVKPFWQIENFNHQKPPLLKSMRFTTLPKINRKTRKTTDSSKWLTSTEPITLRLAEYADYQSEPVTEKYLSFDELMHLRKISDGFAHYDIRRQGAKGATTTKKAAATTKKAAATTKKAAATTKKAAATTKKAAATTKKAAATTKPAAATTKKAAATTKPASATTKPASATTKPTSATTKPASATTKPTAATTKTAAATTTKATTKTTKPTTKASQQDSNDSEEELTTAINFEYTANTPFERVKYCTRRLTCTWTFYTGTNGGDENGEDGDKPFNPQIVGSRTPPGYVEGCTRTSTCTRDYMERNKIFTVIKSSSKFSSDSTNIPEDEDYCERRSLNVQRRNSDSKKSTVQPFRYLHYTNIPILTVLVDSDPTFNAHNTETVTESVLNTHDCICNEKYAREKRATECSKFNADECDNSRSSFSYNNLYYLILNKIMNSHQANKFHNKPCPCNNSLSSSPVMFLFLLILLNTIYS